MALAGDDPARVEPDEPGTPVRDLAPRRRLLYWSMLVALAVIAIGAAVMGSALVTAAVASVVVIGALVAQSVLSRRGSADPRTIRVADERRPSPSSATDRLAAFVDRLDRLPTDAVRLLAVRPLDPVGHEASRERAMGAARIGGRTALVDDATARIADWIARAFGTRSFDPEMVALAWRHEPLRLEDRERLRETLADAALAIAVEDLVDDATHAELVGPCGRLVGDAPDEEAGDGALR